MSKGLFVLGTGTDIGKTYVTGLLLKFIRDNGYDATYFKAALSGAIRDENDNLIPGDAVEVLTMAGLEEDTDFLVPYVYETAVSPHLASQIEGNPVELDKIRSAYDEVSKKYDYIVMEGSGGIVCPIRYDGKDSESNIMLEEDELMENDNIKMVEDLCGVDVIAKVYQNDKNLRLDVGIKDLINYFK